MEFVNWKFVIFNTMSVKPKKNDIKKAVDKIPGLIFEQVEFSSSKKEAEPPAPPKNNPNQEKKKKHLVWFGVIILTIIIMIMWSWNTFVNFDTILKKDNNSVLDKVKESFERAKQETAILEPKTETSTTTENKLDNEEIKTKIKNSLNILLDKLNTPTSTETPTNTEPSLPLSKSITSTEINDTHREL